MMPFETIGVFSNEPSFVIPVWKIIRGTSFDTLEVLIVLSVEYRWFQSLPPYVVQSPPCAAAWLVTARSTGATHQRALMPMDTLPFNSTYGAETDREWSVIGRREDPLDPISSDPGRSIASDARADESSVAADRRSHPRVAGCACAGIDSMERRPCRGAFAPRGGSRSGALSDDRVTICDPRPGSQDPRIPTLANESRPGRVNSIQCKALR